jgi:hypothetical protein
MAEATHSTRAARTSWSGLLPLARRIYLPMFFGTAGDLLTSPVLSLVAVDLSGGGLAAAGAAATASSMASMASQLPAAAVYVQGSVAF